MVWSQGGWRKEGKQPKLTAEQETWFTDLWGDDICTHSETTKGCVPCLVRYAMDMARTLESLRAQLQEAKRGKNKSRTGVNIH